MQLEDISSEQAAALPDSVIIIDVRTPAEYAAGHIEGARNIDIYDPSFGEKIDALDRNEQYFVYCRSGARSKNATLTMQELGFSHLYNLKHGIIEWTAEGRPLVK